MKQEKMRTTIELVGIFAVVGSLLLLTWEINQNRKLAIAQVYENRSQAASEHFIQLRDSPYFKEVSLLLAADASESEVNAQRKKTYLRWWMNTQDNHHYQYQQGFLDQEYYDKSFTANIRLAAPMWRAVGIEEYRSSFKAEVDRILAEGDDR
jgi:hypothetical protein